MKVGGFSINDIVRCMFDIVKYNIDNAICMNDNERCINDIVKYMIDINKCMNDIVRCIIDIDRCIFWNWGNFCVSLTLKL